MAAPLALLCGQLLVSGVTGTELAPNEENALAGGTRGGVVLFARNVLPGSDGPRGVLALARRIHHVAAGPATALVGIDQEGGRVVRIGPPALALPAMRSIGELGDAPFATRLATAQARELASMGITINFAPVADVHTNAENPVIGARAFARTPSEVAKLAAAWAAGLLQGGVLSCAKHFPGHGDTHVDSHLALPRVERSRTELDAIELAPFRALARDPNVTSMMIAHVVFPALDPEGNGRPASLSPVLGTRVLRDELRFDGVLFSDDLEMKAITQPMGEAAVLAVAAGCDALLVCHREELVEEALAALVREAEQSDTFRARCTEAHARFVAMRRRLPLTMAPDAAGLDRALAASAPIASELASRLAARLT